MLYLSLPFALVMVVAAHAAARPAPHPTRWGRFLVGSAAVTVPFFFFCMVFPPVAAGVFALLGAALLVWPVARRRVPTFLPFSAVAVVTAYGVWFCERQTVYERLVQQNPLESMADRVPEVTSIGHSPPSAAAAAQLDQVEETVKADRDRETFRGGRTGQLRRLHTSTVWAFINSSGFGVGRMRPDFPTEKSLRDRSVREEVPAQPGSPPGGGHWPPFEPAPGAVRDGLDGLHAGALLDFVNPRDWGYVQERGRVAGFLAHQFSRVPEDDAWRVQRVELVGLLRHPEPVVYLSDRLPAMDELRAAPTRAPDSFEAAGVAALRRGGDGFAGRRGDAVRFVGGIRNARQCVECHGGERGDLLGAFSYLLLPADAPVVPAKR